MSFILSKTDFLEYLQCPKCLWLKKNKPEIYTPPDLTDFDIKNFSEGHEVDVLVRELFPNGVLLKGSTKDSSVKTKELIEQKKSPIFQATFIVDDVLVAKADILVYNSESGIWDIYEAKSSSSIKTDRDHNHIKDVAFQKIIAEKSGVKIGETYIIHLNKDYKKDGELNLNELFVKNNISEDVKNVIQITNTEISEALSMLNDNAVKIDSCSCIYLTRSNHCSSFNVLNPSVPEYSVHDIARINPAKLKSFIDSGIMDISKVSESFELTDIQRNQVSVEQAQEIKINKPQVQKVIKDLNFPLYFIDYETYMSAIPILDRFNPHQHLPFQVSVHVLESSGKLGHFEYLAESIDEAMPGLIKLMKKIIGNEGSIISWHASFENDRNRKMSELYPEHSTFLLDLISRTFDLESIFKKDYVHYGFRGKTSIKKVLPVLIPEFSYGNLNIQGGTEAMESWRKIIFDGISDSEKEEIKNNLLEYCKMDTLAMVKIYEILKDLK